MKKLTLHYFILFFICISCDQTKIHPVLTQAEDLMGTKPDSSLLLLERIEYPEKMSKQDYATWCLLITQARDKNYVEHTSDSIITVAVNYFEEKNIPSRKAWSYFYLGRIQSLLYSQNEDSKFSLYYSIASTWTDLCQPDSAFHYLHEAMKSDNLYIKCSGNRLLYKLYGQKGELKKSHEANEEYLHLHDSIEISNRPAEIAKMEALYQKEKSENEKQTIILKSKEKQFTYLLILLISYIIGSLIANKYHSRLKAQQHKLQKNKHVLIEKQDLLLTSLQNQIEEKARQLETEKLYLKQMQEENNETVSQLLWKQENTNRELNALRDEKYRILNMQEETYRERSLLLKGKKQLDPTSTLRIFFDEFSGRFLWG